MEQKKLRIKLMEFEKKLREEEKAPATIEKYLRDVRDFASWLGDREINKEIVSEWKRALLQHGRKPATVNAKLAAVNHFFRIAGWQDCQVRLLRLQKRLFREQKKSLTRAEYEKMILTAENRGKSRLKLLMETICATGIRVSEVRYITVEVAWAGKVEIALKGKIRTILLPGKLCRRLQKYAKKQNIKTGEIFLTRKGNPISRKQIWSEMKALCRAAGVEPEKVFPHNLRHLFAVEFYRCERDVVKLADVLGHSSMETTRIYLLTTGEEHRKTLNRLKLIL